MASSDSEDRLHTEFAIEQAHLDVVYAQLDELRRRAGAALGEAVGASTTGTPAARSEREAFVRMYSARVSQLQAVEERLCFGRLDLTEGTRRYIGRIGISDADRAELLVDWRAPAAEPFYQATAARPAGVLRRRQLGTSGRRVSSINDEVLDVAAFAADGVAGGHTVVGEGALFASLDAARSGRMRDIVATIQADQDKAIRAPLAGILVVQGGPGTGKTAVALHRTAFLLYANRERIARSGVLLVGPNRVFLRYIEQVLPALGESEAVLMRTPGELHNSVVATRDESDPAVASLKGDLRMAEVIREAVKRRQRLPRRPIRLRLEKSEIVLDFDDVRAAREKARRSGEPHNQARPIFVKDVLRVLVRRLAEARELELDADARESLLGELHESIDVRREVNLLWMPLSPERLLRDLYANEAFRRECTQRLRGREGALLARDRSAAWTICDVPLLDEAAELLGPEPGEPEAAAPSVASERAEVEYAKAVAQTFGGGDFVSAEELAQRYRGTESKGSIADRAALDRQWAFGHIVVDEAQELSAMMWRLLLRRSAARSMTLVGDVAQTGAMAGATSWAGMLGPLVGDRWQLARLNVNYRTPAQIMAVAASFMAAHGADAEVPTSARSTDAPVEYTKVSDDSALPEAVAVAAEGAWRAAGEGTVAVIVPQVLHSRAVVAARSRLGAQIVSSDTAALGSPVSVLTVADAKGLEFDAVIIADPARIIADSPHGVHDMYVALTRPTQRLQIIHAGSLPAGLRPAVDG